MQILGIRSITRKLNITTALMMLLVSGVLPYFQVSAFQIRNADSLRVMQSNPYAESANFRVSADMLIQPSSDINMDATQAQAPAPTPIPNTPPVEVQKPVVTSSGSGSSEKYDASDWILSRKYEELVKARDGDGPFLASAPDEPGLKFDYLPTDPNLVQIIDINPDAEEFFIAETEAPESYIPGNEPICAGARCLESLPVAKESMLSSFRPSTAGNAQAPERFRADLVLTTATPNDDSVMVVPLKASQKKTILRAGKSRFGEALFGNDDVESWHTAAPVNPESETCDGTCGPVWNWQWCVFVVWMLILIVVLLLLVLALQLYVIKREQKPKRNKSYMAQVKKLLQRYGFLVLVIFSASVSTTYAQGTTTPQELIYEGELLDNAGVPVTGSYTFRFSFWNNSDYEATDVTGGVINTGAADYLGWNEVQTTTTTTDGSFSLELGMVTPFLAGMFDQDSLFLQVEVKNAGDPDTAYEFVDINLADATIDRKVIASVPFAFNANKLDYKELGFGANQIPYLDANGWLPASVLPDLNLGATDLDLTDITLSDFTNDLSLNDGQVWIGDATNTATAVTITGDATLSNTGVFSLADNSVDGAAIELGGETTGGLMFYDGTDWTALGIGTAGQILTTNPGGTAPEWTDAPSGDLAGLLDTNIAAPVAGQILTYDAVNAEWDNVAVSGDATLSDTGVFDLNDDAVEASEIATDAVGDDAIDYSQVTLADFTNDAGFITSDTLSALTCAANEIAKWNGIAWVCSPDAGGAAFTASDGITLTGSNFTNDFGTSIEGAEITDGTITAADLDLADITLSDFTNDAGFLLAETQDLTLVGNDLSISGGSTIDLSAFAVDGQTLSLVGTDLTISGGNTIDLSTIDTDTDTTYTASGGVTLTGTNFTADLGTTISSGEIETNAVGDLAIDYTQVTLNDFTNDANFVTAGDNVSGLTNDAGYLSTVDVSDNTNLTAGTGLTLVDDTLSADLGTDISTSEIQDDAVTAAKIGTAGVADANKVLTTDLGGNPQWEDRSNFLSSALTSGTILIGNGVGTATAVTVSGDATLDNTGALSLGTDVVSDNEIDYATVTLADFTNDAGFLTAVDVSDNTNLAAGTGATLTGDTISVNLGDEIDSSEIVDGSIAQADLNLTDITLSDFTNDAGYLTTETQDISLAGTNLSISGGSTIDLSSIDTDTDTTYTAGSGLTLTGTTFSANLGNTIDATEIETNAVGDDEINYSAVTLSDFTNDAGFLTTVDISANTNLAAGSGLTLIGDSIISNLGDTINSGEIQDGTIMDNDLNLTDITISDFTNDAGYLSSVDISDNTNLTAGTGVNLVGDTISTTLGTSIDATEIETNAVGDDEIDYSAVTVSDFTNDAGYLSAESQDISLVGSDLSITGGSTIDLSVIDTDTLGALSCSNGQVAKWSGAAWICAPDAGGASYTASNGITLTGSNFTNDLGTSIETTEITDGTITQADLNLTDITVSDFTNDAGYLSTVATGDITDGTIAAADLNLVDITLSDFTNDAGYITTDSDTLAALSCSSNQYAEWNGVAWACAGGFSNTTQVLSARYPQSIFEADGSNNTGSMFEEEEVTVGTIINTIIRWFSGQTVLNDYDVVIQWTVPENFTSFQAQAISLDYQTENLVTDSAIDMTAYHNGNATDQLLLAGQNLSSNTWTTGSFALNGATVWVPGDTLKIRLRMKARNDNSAKIGNIKIHYVES